MWAFHWYQNRRPWMTLNQQGCRALTSALARLSCKQLLYYCCKLNCWRQSPECTLCCSTWCSSRDLCVLFWVIIQQFYSYSYPALSGLLIMLTFFLLIIICYHSSMEWTLWLAINCLLFSTVFCRQCHTSQCFLQHLELLSDFVVLLRTTAYML